MQDKEKTTEEILDALAGQISDLFLAHIAAAEEKKSKQHKKVFKNDTEERSQSIQ